MLFFFLNDPAPPKFSPLPLPAPLPIPLGLRNAPATTPAAPVAPGRPGLAPLGPGTAPGAPKPGGDRKSTRLNSSHSQISYAVFCLKKKKNTTVHLTSTEVQSESVLWWV